jgi:hypothetical protein
MGAQDGARQVGEFLSSGVYLMIGRLFYDFIFRYE